MPHRLAAHAAQPPCHILIAAYALLSPVPPNCPQFCYEKRESFILSGLIPLLCLLHLTGLMPELADKGEGTCVGGIFVAARCRALVGNL